MKFWIQTLLKFSVGAFFFLSSLYCVLAYIPYTYFFLIKNPPYPWLAGFAWYHRILYWCVFAACLAAYWPLRKKRLVLISWAALAVIGAIFAVWNFLPNIGNSESAYIASLILSLPMALLALADTLSGKEGERIPTEAGLFSYLNAALTAAVIAVLAILAAKAGAPPGSRWFAASGRTFQVFIYVMVTYFCFAWIVISVINLLILLTQKFTGAGYAARNWIAYLAVSVGLAIACAIFLQDSLTFRGWMTYAFAFIFGPALSLWGLSILHAVLLKTQSASLFWRRLSLSGLGLCLAAAAFIVPAMIGENDWNGILRSSFTWVLWILGMVCIFAWRPRLKDYSTPALAAVLLVTGFGYWSATATAFLWGRQLGISDNDVVRTMDGYAKADVSFGMIYHLLSGSHQEPCGYLCRTLRQYTNIRNAQAKVDLELVDKLTPTRQDLPNIFMIVVDSMRRDYLGPYNRAVDFTPNLNAFAGDSVVEQNAYTQYAGTALSEAAIWSGALLLHAQYMQPFSRVDSLEKLVRTDDYQMMVSYDDILRLILAPNPGMIKLDATTRWNEFELSNTLRQLESALDRRTDQSRPIFFYAQPKNVHELAHNQLPPPAQSNWNPPAGFVQRIAFELRQVDGFLGEFFSYLKTHGLYDNSIIIITADHGDATGELGRSGHSSIIFPEVMRIPLLVHLPQKMRSRLAYDPEALTTLTDITPSLYYLLGHKPIKNNPIFGHPLFTETPEELKSFPRPDIFFASDSRAAYGLLADKGRLMYVAYDSPPSSFLFDLTQDPNATRNVLTDSVRKQYEDRVIQYLKEIADFYQYKPTGGKTLLSLSRE